MNAHNFYPMNNQTKIKITGTPSGFITCGLPQVGAAVSNSDTPRTDNLIVETHSLGTWGELVNADFARKLERENAALRADKERLDWLETNGREQVYGPTWRIAWQFGQDVSLRAVIDAARKEEQP